MREGWEQRHPREVLKEREVWAKKSLGQHFLVDSEAMEKIVAAADLGPREAVLEVGTGLARLTARLARRAGRVVTVEIDRRLHAIARERLGEYPNVTVLRCDFLESKHRINPRVTEALAAAPGEAEPPPAVVSNLPYSISSPAVVNLLEWELRPERMVLTLQREVGQRMTAEAGTKDYGPLTVFVRYWAEVRELFSLPPQAFWPKPGVSSTVVELIRRPRRRRGEDYEAFAAAVRSVFNYRRKTVRKALSLAWDRPTAQRMLRGWSGQARTRVEELTVEDFETLARLSPGPPGG